MICASAFQLENESEENRLAIVTINNILHRTYSQTEMNDADVLVQLIVHHAMDGAFYLSSGLQTGIRTSMLDITSSYRLRIKLVVL